MKTVDRRNPLLAVGTLGLVLALGFSACQKVPYTGRQQVISMSLDAEASLGAEAFTEILAAETVIPSGDLYGQVSTSAAGVAAQAPQPFRDLPWEFKLINSESVNAFALPGGKVGVYTGILPVLSNEAGLASVLGHEVGHVVARHSAERITGMLALQTALTAADIGLSTTALHDELMGLLGLGAQVGVVLPFSRANELESDYLGGIFMAKAGNDPSESWAVWERMSALGGGSPIALFSTHPSNSKRIERLKEELPTFEKHYKASKEKKGRGNDLRIDLVPAPPADTGATKPPADGGDSGDGETKTKTKGGSSSLMDEGTAPSGGTGAPATETEDDAPTKTKTKGGSSSESAPDADSTAPKTKTKTKSK